MITRVYHVILIVIFLIGGFLISGCALLKPQVSELSKDTPIKVVVSYEEPVPGSKVQVEQAGPVPKVAESKKAETEQDQEEEIEAAQQIKPELKIPAPAQRKKSGIAETGHLPGLKEKKDDLVTLDFKGEKFCNVLKVFSYITGKNVVASEDLSDKEISIYLANILPRSAIKAICGKYGLWYEEKEDYIRLREVRYGKIVMSKGKIKELRFKGQRLDDVLSLFSDLTDQNVTCNENIADKMVTVHLEDIPVRIAIEAICKKYGLWYREDKENNYLCLIKAEDYGKDIRLDYKVRVRIFDLKYISAPQLADSIACVMGNRVEYAKPAHLKSYEHLKLPDIEEEEGKIEMGKAEAEVTKEIKIPEFEKQLTSDKIEGLIKKKLDLRLTAEDLRQINKEIGFAIITIFLRNNSIIACSTDDRILDKIEELIEKLDTPTPQVLIECRILETTLTDDFTSFFQLTNFGYREKGGESYGEAAKTWTAPIFGAAGANAFYNFVDDKWKLDLQMKLLKEDGIINIIGTPMIVAAQNSQAILETGLKNFPLFEDIEVVPPVFDDDNKVTMKGYTTPRYKSVDLVGTELKITPQINEDKSVTLKININQSTIIKDAATIQYSAFDADGNPVTPWKSTDVDVLSENSVATIAVVPESHTLAIGGLVTEKDMVVEDKVPFLGDIPIIGFFFKDHKTIKKRTEMVFLLTPHIIMTPEEAGKVSREALEGIEHPVVKEGKKQLFEFDEKRKKLRRTK